MIDWLLLVTDRKQATAPLADILGAAFAAGCRWASVREKDLPPEEQVDLARDLLRLARRFGARLTLHGDPDAGVGASMACICRPVPTRPQRAPRSALKADRHLDPRRSRGARLDRTIDYAVLGPVYATASKPGYGPALGAEGVRQIARGAAVPIIAIGGITPQRVADVMSAGAAGVAVMGSVMRSQDPGAEVEALLAALPAPMKHVSAGTSPSRMRASLVLR